MNFFAIVSLPSFRQKWHNAGETLPAISSSYPQGVALSLLQEVAPLVIVMMQPLLKTVSQIHYPDSDGRPMADNTKQFRWIVTIKENLELLFVDDPNIFVAGDLLWYPIEGDNTICQAPDVMVVIGRPKGDRGSYKQWEEDNLPPQVTFEILSPGNRLKEMVKKLKFYDRHQVAEYYVYDPDDNELIGWQRGEQLEIIEEASGWTSPLLGIRFEITSETLEIYRPDGDRFLGFTELAQLRDRERQRAETERQRAETALTELEAERQRAETALTELEAERRRSDELAARLREMGIDLNERDEG
ncbi:Uma2 family endonuclease [Phormidesmis sp. 146-12]